MPQLTTRVVGAVNAKFKVGDEVIYTNPQGVVLGNKTIIGVAPPYLTSEVAQGVPRYYIAPTDTPWYSVRESDIVLVRPFS